MEHDSTCAQDILRANNGADMGAGLGEMWLKTRFETPYLRDPMLDRGLGVDTVETAASWEHLPQLHREVSNALEQAIRINTPPPACNSIVMAISATVTVMVQACILLMYSRVTWVTIYGNGKTSRKQCQMPS